MAERAEPPAPLQTAVCKRLGCRYPIVQTAMGWVSTPRLVAASGEAGAFGLLAAATLTPEELRRAIAEIRNLTDRPFGVSFLMEQPGAPEIVEILVEEKVTAAGYNRGPDASLIERLKAAGVICMPTVGAVRHSVKAVELGADILIGQGAEGGGHTGQVATSLLLEQMRNEVDVPIIAAGGFHDGHGLVAALAYGAEGIAMGTRFMLTTDCEISPTSVERYLKARPEDAVVTKAFDGLPQRVLRNSMLGQVEKTSRPTRYVRALQSALEFRRLSGLSLTELGRMGLASTRSGRLTRSQALMAAIAPVLVRKALIEGDPDHGILPTGQVTGVIEDVPSCEQLVERIVEKATAVLAELAR